MIPGWRLIISPPLDGATNMALDHALAQQAGAGHALPTLRLYRWHPACLSLGYFQRLSDVNLAACQAAGVQVVRRPTGGRAILHAAELTYSITAPANYPPFGGRILPAYRVISMGLLAGLRKLNVEAAWAGQAASAEESAACFDTPSDYEITVAGRKLIGSAQTRTSGALLQHGTLLLSADADRLHSLLHLPTLTPVELAARMIALDEAAGRVISFDEAAQAVVAGFAHSWDITFVADEPTAEEWQRAAAWRERRYANADWTSRRA